MACQVVFFLSKSHVLSALKDFLRVTLFHPVWCGLDADEVMIKHGDNDDDDDDHNGEEGRKEKRTKGREAGITDELDEIGSKGV